jgi:glycosyltransferase involved in cell wall biosynthesis
MPTRDLISIIVPCHDEAENIEPLFVELKKVLGSVASARFELIFVDDGSSDDTVAALRSLQIREPRVRIIELVRNFSKEIAITAGLNVCRGQAAICLDADLQHPPALIPELIAKWGEGAEVVIGVRRTGKGHTGVVKRLAGGLFYRLMNAVSDVEIVPHATDYRLIDRAVIDEFNRFTERNRITRGLIDWLGFRRAYVEFTPAKRRAGESTYGYIKLVHLAVNSIVSMSLFPLKAAGYFGVVIVLVSGPLGFFIFVEKYILQDPWHLNITGTAILGVILMFLVGIILISLGLMALYVASIHTEVMNRPLYVARREKGRSDENGKAFSEGLFEEDREKSRI